MLAARFPVLSSQGEPFQSATLSEEAMKLGQANPKQPGVPYSPSVGQGMNCTHQNITSEQCSYKLPCAVCDLLIHYELFHFT